SCQQTVKRLARSLLELVSYGTWGARQKPWSKSALCQLPMHWRSVPSRTSSMRARLRARPIQGQALVPAAPARGRASTTARPFRPGRRTSFRTRMRRGTVYAGGHSILLLEFGELFHGQQTPVTWSQPLRRYTGLSSTGQAHDGALGMLAQTTNLAISSFLESEFQPGFIAFAAQHTSSGRACRAAFDHDTFSHALEGNVIDETTHFCYVYFGGSVLCLLQRTGKVAIVGEQQNSASMEVQAPHGDNASTHTAQQIGHCWSPLWVM